jgi:hypothetical protein
VAPVYQFYFWIKRKLGLLTVSMVLGMTSLGISIFPEIYNIIKHHLRPWANTINIFTFKFPSLLVPVVRFEPLILGLQVVFYPCADSYFKLCNMNWMIIPVLRISL